MTCYNCNSLRCGRKNTTTDCWLADKIIISPANKNTTTTHFVREISSPIYMSSKTITIKECRRDARESICEFLMLILSFTQKPIQSEICHQNNLDVERAESFSGTGRINMSEGIWEKERKMDLHDQCRQTATHTILSTKSSVWILPHSMFLGLKYQTNGHNSTDF